MPRLSPSAQRRRIRAHGQAFGEALGRLGRLQPDGSIEITPADYHAAHRAPPGLGDRVAAVAQPIARALDRVLGTDIQHCGGCQRRREALNRLGEKLRD